MKNIKEKINILINQYENFRDLDNFNEIFKQINERVIFGGFEEFCDKKIETNSYDSCGKKEIKPMIMQIKSHYFYSISFCSKFELNYDLDFNSIIQELNYSNSNNKLCLSKIHKNIYINDIIKSKKFDVIILLYLNIYLNAQKLKK